MADRKSLDLFPQEAGFGNSNDVDSRYVFGEKFFTVVLFVREKFLCLMKSISCFFLKGL